MTQRSRVSIRLAVATILAHGFLFGNQFAFADNVEPEESSNNTVTVNSSSYTINDTQYTFDNELDYVYGSSRNSTDASGNTVTINGALIFYGAYGGYGVSSASGNSIYFTEGSSSSNAFSGYGGFSAEGTVSNNSLTITNWSGGSGLTSFAGGFSQYGDVTDNKVTVNGGTIYTVSGGESYSGNVSGNTLTINGGTIEGVASGGVTSYISEDGSIVNAGDITGNTINIYGGSIAAVTGGSTGFDSNLSSSDINGSSVQITDNVINFYGGSVSGLISGGTGSYGETVSGNTLNVYSSGLSAGNISDFDTINFYVPSDMTTSSSAMLTLTNSGSTTDLSGTSINARVYSDYSLNEGDTITLLSSSGTLNTEGTTYGTLYDGVSYVHELSFSSSGNSITATLGEKTLNGPIAVATESTHAMNTLVNLSPDIFPTPDNELTNETDNSGDDDSNSNEGVYEQIVVHNDNQLFANMGAGSLKTKLKNGGYIDSKNGGIDVGISRAFRNSRGIFTIAPLIDYGHGKYDSYLSNGTHGYGDSDYYAGGFVARQMMSRSGMYYEGALRVGQSKMNFNSDSVVSDHAHSFYDTDALILSGHIRIGNILRPNRRDILHTFFMYSHNYQGSSDTDMHTVGYADEHYEFSAVNSGKFRTGFRATRAVKPFSRVYTGMAFQYEYSQNSVTKFEGNDLPSTKSQGSSGMLELGWQIKPTESSPWLLDMNVAGWMGHQEGVTFQMKVKKEF